MGNPFASRFETTPTLGGAQKMLPRRPGKIGLLALALLATAAAAVFSLNALINHPPFQAYVLARLSAPLGYTLEAEHIRVTFLGRLGLRVHAVSVTAAPGGPSFTAESLRVFFLTRQLLRGRLVPQSLLVHNVHL
jgi:hypothetical protein